MKGVVERALAIAPHCNSVREVKSKLKELGYSTHEIELHLAGRLIRSQIVERLLPSDKKRRVR